MLAQLPVDKLESYSSSVEELLQKDKVQLRELQSVIGKLQFATTIIKVGRPFLRRLYDLTYHVAKPFYMVRISKEAKEDLRMWLDFLRGYNGKTILYQPSIAESNAINLFSDASGLGFGGMYGYNWVQGKWPDHWASLNIAVLELYPIVLLLQLFGQKMANTMVLFHCDNAAIVEVINKQTSKSKQIMQLLRPLILVMLKHNIRFRSQHLSSASNYVADAISRFQETPKLLQEAGLKLSKTAVPYHLLPESYKL